MAQLKSSIGTQMHVNNRGQLPNCSWVGRSSNVTNAFCRVASRVREWNPGHFRPKSEALTTGLPRHKTFHWNYHKPKTKKKYEKNTISMH